MMQKDITKALEFRLKDCGCAKEQIEALSFFVYNVVFHAENNFGNDLFDWSVARLNGILEYISETETNGNLIACDVRKVLFDAYEKNNIPAIHREIP